MTKRTIIALATFTAFDGTQMKVFNAAKLDEDGNVLREATTDELPENIAQTYVDAGQAEFAAEPDAPAKGKGKAKASKPTAKPDAEPDAPAKDDGDGEPIAGETDAPAA